jgi:hypothetical protein
MSTRRRFWKRSNYKGTTDSRGAGPIGPRSANRRHIATRLAGLTLILTVLAFGLGSGLRSMRRAIAQEDYANQTGVTETPDASITPAVAVDQDPCTGGPDNLPKPTPMPGAVRVVQLGQLYQPGTPGCCECSFQGAGYPGPCLSA